MSANPNSYRDDWLDSEEFYNICQLYRHAHDAPDGSVRLDGFPTAVQAFERLKDEIAQHYGPKGRFKAIGYVGESGDPKWEPGEDPRLQPYGMLLYRSDATSNLSEDDRIAGHHAYNAGLSRGDK